MIFTILTPLVCPRNLSIVTEWYLRNVVNIFTQRQWKEFKYILVRFHGIKSHWFCRGKNPNLEIKSTSRKFFSFWGVLVSCV